MTGKFLGKITSAEFGSDADYTCELGLKLSFSISSGCVNSGFKYMTNVNLSAQTENQEAKNFASILNQNILKILNDAKVYNVSGLVGKPVEVTIVDNIFEDFRILTEVL